MHREGYHSTDPTDLAGLWDSTNPSKPVPKGTHGQVRALKDLDPDDTDDKAFKLVTHIIGFLPILMVFKLSCKIILSRVVAPLFVSDNPQIIQYGVPVREAMNITSPVQHAPGGVCIMAVIAFANNMPQRSQRLGRVSTSKRVGKGNLGNLMPSQKLSLPGLVSNQSVNELTQKVKVSQRLLTTPTLVS